MRDPVKPSEIEDVVTFWSKHVKTQDQWTRLRQMVRFRADEGVPPEDLKLAARRYARELENPPTRYAMAGYKFYSYVYVSYLSPDFVDPPEQVSVTPWGLPAKSGEQSPCSQIADPDEWLQGQKAPSFSALLRARREP